MKKMPSPLWTRKILNEICHALSSSMMGGKSPILLLAPTGNPAFNIHGKQIHSTLKIPIKDMKPVNGQDIIAFQEEMRHV